MALTETQKTNVDILRSQGDSDEQIAKNLGVDIKDVKPKTTRKTTEPKAIDGFNGFGPALD